MTRDDGRQAGDVGFLVRAQDLAIEPDAEIALRAEEIEELGGLRFTAGTGMPKVNEDGLALAALFLPFFAKSLGDLGAAMEREVSMRISRPQSGQ